MPLIDLNGPVLDLDDARAFKARDPASNIEVVIEVPAGVIGYYTEDGPPLEQPDFRAFILRRASALFDEKPSIVVTVDAEALGISFPD